MSMQVFYFTPPKPLLVKNNITQLAFEASLLQANQKFVLEEG